MIVKVEEQIYSVYQASETALFVLSKLPDTAETEALQFIIETQNQILNNIIHHRHYGSDRLQSFLNGLQAIEYNMKSNENAVD